MTRRPLPAPALWTALNSVHRWHTTPALVRLLQTNAQHSGSMAALALDLWPDCSRALLVGCIMHDAPEYVTGDMPGGAKHRYPGLKSIMDQIEDDAADTNGWGFKISETDADRLKFLDRLEPYLFAALHAPHILGGNGWPEAIAWLEAECGRLAPDAPAGTIIAEIRRAADHG